MLINIIKVAIHLGLGYILDRFARKELNQLTLQRVYLVLGGIHEPLLVVIHCLHKHQVNQRVRLTYVGVASYNNKLAVFESQELIYCRVAKFASVVVFAASCSFKERQYLFVRN